MSRVIVLSGVAVGLYVLYMLAFVYMSAAAAVYLTPVWWQSSFSNPRTAVLSWLFVDHLLGLILVSTPFAFAIDRLYGRVAVPVALGVAAVTWLTIEAPLLVHGPGSTATYVRTFQMAEAVELLVTLPLLTLLMLRPPSNNRIERARER